MKKIHPYLITLIFIYFCFNQKIISSVNVQDNPVLAEETDTIPVIDGSSADACWTNAKWQTIDQTWFPYGGVIASNDFSGRYKVVWSSVTNKLYFLVEVIDDALVKGYTFPADGWWNWDCVEMFIDEDHSGGVHTYNNNAFAYHITAGNAVDSFQAIDLGSDQKPINYSNHLKVSIKNTGTTYIWEIELTVYDATLNEVKLAKDKVSGFVLAYCDNDNPNESPKTRDNFIGSIAIDQAHSNDFYMNASLFGQLKLVSNLTNIKKNDSSDPLKLFINDTNELFTFEYHSPNSETISYQLMDISGKIVASESFDKSAGSLNRQISTNSFAPGVYIFNLISGQNRYERKIYISNR